MFFPLKMERELKRLHLVTEQNNRIAEVSSRENFQLQTTSNSPKMENELKRLNLVTGQPQRTNDGQPRANSQPQAEARDSLKHILKEFNNRNQVSEEDRKRNMAILKDLVLEKFITAMKTIDPLFNELYQETFYTGSYYDGLKVSDANEFDLNIVLELPFRQDAVQIVYNNVPSGYAQYKIIKPIEVLLAKHTKWPIYQKLSSIIEKDHLSQVKINEWLQGVGDKALQQRRDLFPNITRSRHGPAFTLNIKTGDGTLLDVDLVPVVKLMKYPPSVRKTPFLKPDSICYIVPKPTGAANDTGFNFRISMPLVERTAMNNKGCVKMLIRIFKAIRDNEKWKPIASYYIKTLFLWELENNPKDEYWSEARMDHVFIEMLKKFIEALEKKDLPHFLFLKYNLIAGLNPATLTNIKQRLTTYLDKSQKDLCGLRALLFKN